MSLTSVRREGGALAFVSGAVVLSSSKSASQSLKHTIHDMLFSVFMMLAVTPVRASSSVKSLSSATMGSQIENQQHLLLRVGVMVQMQVLTPETSAGARTNDDSFPHHWSCSQSSLLNVDKWRSYIVTLDDFEMSDSGSGTQQENSNEVVVAGETIAEQILTLPWAPTFRRNSTSNLLLLHGVTSVSFLLPMELSTAKSRMLMVGLWEDEVWIESEASPIGDQYSKPPTLLARRLINLPSRTRSIPGAYTDPSYGSSVVEVQLSGETSFLWPLDKKHLQAAGSFASWWWRTLAGGIFLLTCVLCSPDHFRDSAVSWLGDRLVPGVVLGKVAYGDDPEGAAADDDDISCYNWDNKRRLAKYSSVAWWHEKGQLRRQRVPPRTPNQYILEGSMLKRGEALKAKRQDDSPSQRKGLQRIEATPTGGLAQAAAGTLNAQHDAQNLAHVNLKATILDTHPNGMQAGQRELQPRRARTTTGSTAAKTPAEAPKEALKATPQHKNNETLLSQGQQSIRDETISNKLGVRNTAFTETPRHAFTATELNCGQKQSQTDTIPATDLEGHQKGETTKDALLEKPQLKPTDTTKETEAKIQHNYPPGRIDPRYKQFRVANSWTGDTKESPAPATMKSRKKASHVSSKNSDAASAGSDNEPSRPNGALKEASSVHPASTEAQGPIGLDGMDDRDFPRHTISPTGKATHTQPLAKSRETLLVSLGEQALLGGHVDDMACSDIPGDKSFLNDMVEPNPSLDASRGTRPVKKSELIQMSNGNDTTQPKAIRENNWLYRLRERGATQDNAATRASHRSQPGSDVSTLPRDRDASQDRHDFAPRPLASRSSSQSIPARLRLKRASEVLSRTRNGQAGSSKTIARKSEAAPIYGVDVNDGAVICLEDSPGKATTSTLHLRGIGSTEGARKRPHPHLERMPLHLQEFRATKPKLANAKMRKKRYSNAHAMALPDVAPSAALSKAAQQMAIPVWEVDVP
jgi:hypothetical protein